MFFSTSGLVFASKEIPTIIISGNKLKYSMTNSLGIQKHVQVISDKQLSSSGYKSLLEAVSARSGLQIIEPEGGPGRAFLSIRGFGDNAKSNVLILYDGLPYSTPDLGALPLNILPLFEIKQIEILPGSSILYGDQAVGGSVNILTKESIEKTSRISTSYGSFNTRQAQISLGGGKIGNFYYRIGASTYISNNYRKHNLERTDQLFIKLAYQDVYFNYHKVNQLLEMPGKLTWYQVEQDPRQAENNISYNNQYNNNFCFGIKHTFFENWLTKLDTSLRLMEGTGAYAYNQTFISFDEARQIATLQAKTSGVINLHKNTIFPILGIDLNYGKYNISLNSNKAKQYQTALYGQFSIPLSNKITIVFGSRYGLSFYSLPPTMVTETNPRNHALVNSVELAWNTLNNIQLFAKWVENYRFPKTDEAAYTLNKTPLRTQKGTSYEIGTAYKKNNFSSSLTLYQLDIKDEISAIPIPTANYFIYNENLDLTRRIGAIVDISCEPTKYLQLSANYNFVNAKLISENLADKKIPLVASNNLRLAITLKPHNALQLTMEGLYTGKRYPTNDVENLTNPLGGYTIYNCNISYETAHYVLALRGNNLTNKLYYGNSVVTYQGSANSTWYYPSAGINVLATLTIKISTTTN